MSRADTVVNGQPFRWHKAHTQDDLENFYKSILPAIRAAAKICGYAIGVHGSMRRDLDLIAAPWVDDHSDKDTLAKAVQIAACGIANESYEWTSHPSKPCGRVGTVFPVCWSEYRAISSGHIDLAVMPDTAKLENENFSLAANQCLHDAIFGGDGGTPCCKIKLELDAAKETIELLRFELRNLKLICEKKP